MQRELTRVVAGDDPFATVDALAGQIGSLRLLVDQFPAVFWTTDADLRFTSSLGAGLASLGLGPNQLVGMTLQDFFEAGQSQPMDAHRRALRGQPVTYLMHWGGRTFHSHVAPLRDGQGGILGTICIAMDLRATDRRDRTARAPGLGPGDGEEWRLTGSG
jgi:PAS domain-containing protein